MHTSKRRALYRNPTGKTCGLVALVFLAVLSLSVLGCGGGPAAAPTTAPAATKAAAPAAATTVPVPAKAAASVAPAATKPASTTVAPAASPAGGAAGANTAGALAEKGKAVYSTSCAGCHGDQGQGVTGPALIGSGARWGRFGNGKDLHDYIQANMPLNAPGSLPADQNLQVTSYVLVQNGFIQPSAPVSESSLSAVQLKK